jgi:AcrR family transcriptional regulator
MSSHAVHKLRLVPATPRRQGRTPPGAVKTAVLAAAERLLADASLEDLTVGQLAREAGVSRASFYFYFESKQAVLAVLLEAVIGEVADAAAPWLERAGTPPEEALKQALGGSIEVWRRRGAVLRAAVESSRSSPEIGELWRSQIGAFIDAAAAQIQRDRQAGVAPADGVDPHALAAALIWMNERTLYVMTLEDDRSGDAQLVETLAAIWLRAVYRI